MATSTFYDNIIIGQEAAERLAKVLKEPPLPRPNIDLKFLEMSDEKLQRILLNLRNSSQCQEASSFSQQQQPISPAETKA